MRPRNGTLSFLMVCVSNHPALRLTPSFETPREARGSSG